MNQIQEWQKRCADPYTGILTVICPSFCYSFHSTAKLVITPFVNQLVKCIIMLSFKRRILTKVLAILPGFIPSTTIDVITPLIELHRAGIIEARINWEKYTSKRDIDWCDIAVLCRNTEPLVAKWFLSLLELGKPYIYDIDDNLFELKGETTSALYHNDPSRRKMLIEYIRLASLVRVYSEPMLDRVTKYNQDSIKVVAPVDFRLISSPEESKKKKTLKIVYATSRPDDYLAEIFKPALKRIMQDYKDKVKVYFLGYNPSDLKRFSNFEYLPLVFDYNKYLYNFSRAGYDIGLAPLFNDVFHRSKTNNKFREYGACRIAGIYSNVDVYSSCVVNHKTGLLVDDDQEAWYKAISNLIENHNLRSTIQDDAYEFVRQNYSQKAFVDLWHKQISQVVNTERHKSNTEVHQLLLATNSSKSNRQKLWKWLLKQIKINLKHLQEYGFLFIIAKIANYIRTLWKFFRLRITLFNDQ